MNTGAQWPSGNTTEWPTEAFCCCTFTCVLCADGLMPGGKQQLIDELGAVETHSGISPPPSWPSSELVEIGHLTVTKDQTNCSHNTGPKVIFH